MDEIYRLYLLSPLHLGERGIGMEESGESIPSDTLFSALCWAVREVEGTGWLEDWLGAFLSGRPPLLLTSAFPFAGDVRFYPRPMLPSRWIPEVDTGVRAPATSPGKRLKGVTYVSEELFRRWVAGESLASEMDESNFVSGGLWMSGAESRKLPPGLSGLWAGPDAVAHVTLDRTSNASTLYQIGEVRYRDGCGLWFGVRWRDTAWRDLLEAVLNCLGEAGIGGERSAGRGQFRWERQGESGFPSPPTAARNVTLSLYHPTREEVEGGRLDDAHYRLRSRRGWVASAEGQGLRGKAVRMLAEGSVIGGVNAGDLVDVTPEVFTAHRVYRYGLAFPVAVEASEDG